MKCATMFLAILFATLNVNIASAEGWPRFGGANGDFAATGSLEIASKDDFRPKRLWQRTLGDSLSGLVVEGDMLFTTYLKPFSDEDAKEKESKRTHTEVAIALNHQ